MGGGRLRSPLPLGFLSPSIRSYFVHIGIQPEVRILLFYVFLLMYIDYVYLLTCVCVAIWPFAAGFNICSRSGGRPAEKAKRRYRLGEGESR